MPPVRTLPAAKPIKTERTHEENQERAYIAASRRSDRSLEARIESARRASEIHKKRTGRGLRVTEQDVINEEMYEEEDEDLPAQYRRLTAHLQTNSMDFNRRLHAYLASQYATRSALLEQGVNNSWAQFYPNAPQFAHNSMLPPVTASMMPPQMIHRSPQSYRQSPYPMPSPQQYGPQTHQRSATLATTQEFAQHQSNYATASPSEIPRPEEQRMSLPAQSLNNSPQMQQQAANQARPSPSRSSSGLQVASADPNSRQSSFEQSASPTQLQPQPQPQPSMMQPVMPYAFQMPMYDPMTQNLSFSPFSTTLPIESQQLLGGTLDPKDPHTPFLMAGSQSHQQPFYSYNPNPTPSAKSRRAQNPTVEGMNQTLAPAPGLSAVTTGSVVPTVLDTTVDASTTYSNPTSATTDGLVSPFTPNVAFNIDATFGDSLKFAMTSNNSAQGSGTVTPIGNADWTTFIEGWEEAAA